MWIRQHQTGSSWNPVTHRDQGKTDERCSSSLCKDYFLSFPDCPRWILGLLWPGWPASPRRLSSMRGSWSRKLRSQKPPLRFVCFCSAILEEEQEWAKKERDMHRKQPNEHFELTFCNTSADGINVCFFLKWDLVIWNKIFLCLFWLVW